MISEITATGPFAPVIASTNGRTGGPDERLPEERLLVAGVRCGRGPVCLEDGVEIGRHGIKRLPAASCVPVTPRAIDAHTFLTLAAHLLPPVAGWTRWDTTRRPWW